MEKSEIFTARDVDSDELEAFIFLQNSLYTRSLDSSTATIRVFRASSQDDVVYCGLVDLGVDFTRMIDIGYMQCFVDVALCHDNLLRQLRQRGFYTAFIVPRGVHIAGLGLRENAVMCKDLGLSDRKVGLRIKNLCSNNNFTSQHTNIVQQLQCYQ